MSTVIQIKRSSNATAPSTLKLGELAYTFGTGTQANNGDRLFVGEGGVDGNGDANNITVIGGQYFVDKLDHVDGTLTASSAITTDSNSAISALNIGNSATVGGTLKFNEGTNNGSHFVSLKSPNSVAANLALSPLRQGPSAFQKLLGLGIVSKVLAMPGLLKYLAFGMKGNTRVHADALARVKAQITASGAMEATAEEDGQGPRRYIESGVEEIPEAIKNKINYGVDMPGVPFVQNQSAGPVEGSRLASANMAPPLTNQTIDPNRAAIAFGPTDMLAQPRMAAQGGIMNARKPIQRVA